MYKIFLLILISLFFGSCDTSKEPSSFSISTEKNNFKLGDTLKIELNNPEKLNIASVQYQLDNEDIMPNDLLREVKLGKKTLTAIISYESKVDTISKAITVFNNKTPHIYTFEIVNTYPHDINAYTQGMEFYKGDLYESTGQYKSSTLRKVNYAKGEVVKKLKLKDNFFGEGLTILNDKIYQLTWKSGQGFIYDITNFEKSGSFKYGKSKEGWGFCNDGTHFYKSDGTEHIWTLNKNSLVEESFIQVYTDKGKIPSLNELEYVKGKIYANIYQRNGVVIINPKNGAVEGVIDFKSLKEKVTQHPELDVLNGIAYHPQRETLFVTGKNWDQLFEVRIKKK